MCLITVLHAFLSCASRIARYISMFFSASCFSISFRRVSLCPPLGFFYCLRPSQRAFLAGAEFGNRHIWPNTRRRRVAIVFDHGFCLALSYNCSFVIQLLFGSQRMFRTLRRSCLWKASIFFSNVLVRVHNSQLYRKILDSNALKIRSLVSSLTQMLVNIGFSLKKAVLVSCLRLSISSVVRRRLPTYLHFFQLSSPSFLMLYLSVLD